MCCGEVDTRSAAHVCVCVVKQLAVPVLHPVKNSFEFAQLVAKIIRKMNRCGAFYVELFKTAGLLLFACKVAFTIVFRNCLKHTHIECHGVQ